MEYEPHPSQENDRVYRWNYIFDSKEKGYGFHMPATNNHHGTGFPRPWPWAGSGQHRPRHLESAQQGSKHNWGPAWHTEAHAHPLDANNRGTGTEPGIPLVALGKAGDALQHGVRHYHRQQA